jgi:hypothetical protein
MALAACGRFGFGDQPADASDGSADAATEGGVCHTGFGDYLSAPIGNDQPPFPRLQSFTVANGVVLDNNTKLEWQQVSDAMARSLAEAKAYCASLQLDGACWRLPERVELVSIANYAVNTGTSSAIDQTAFPGTPAAGFWSATPVVNTPTLGWFVTYADGSNGQSPIASPLLVRCVRSTVDPPPTHYDFGTNIVNDHGTGLVWQRVLDGNSYNFNNAATFCAQLATDGGGWRVPSVQELETIVDTEVPNVSIDPLAFPGTPPGLQWSGTLRSNDATSGWTVDFGVGIASRPIGNSTPVRCVR